MKVVELYIKYYHKTVAVIRELRYPNRYALVQWLKEHDATGDLHQKADTAENRSLPEVYRRRKASGTIVLSRAWPTHHFDHKKHLAILGNAHLNIG